MLNIGLAKEIITPPRGISLAGYFNRRPNRGQLDDVCVRAIAFEKDGVRSGIMLYDLCGLGGTETFEAIRAKMREFGVDFADNVILCATHSHTGPSLGDTKEQPKLAPLYLDELYTKSAMAMRRAMFDLGPGELEVASEINNPYARVRRYFMKDGSVVTNPGKYNPNIVKPESDFDHTITVVAVKKEGRLAAILANIGNHGDSTGGDLVSADWHGRMERYIQHKLNVGLPVFALIDASGDLNQVNNFDDVDPCCVEEATRLGQGYARIVLRLLAKVEPLKFDRMTVKNSTFDLPHRKVSPEQLAEAKKTLAEIPESAGEATIMTSEELASRNPAALRRFAKSLVRCAEESTPSHPVRLTAIEFDKELAFVSLPGEPFNGIARAIRAKSPFKRTLICELAQDHSGYIPMPECFDRGGYETSPGKNSPAVEAATVLAEAALKNL